MFDRRLEIVEYVSIAGSVVGWAVAIATGQFIYAAVPLSISLLLNLLNRLRLEQRFKRRIHAAMTQLHRQLSQESHSHYEQELEEARLRRQRYANALPQAKQPEYLSPIGQTADSGSTESNNVQLEVQLAAIEQTLSHVVQYLNNSSLLERVEELEEAMAATTAEIAQIYRQLPEGWESRIGELERRIPVNRPEDARSRQFSTVTQPHPFSSTASAPEQSLNYPPPLPSWSHLYALAGHADWVSSLTMSPDGQTLVSGSYDRTIKLWHLDTGELTQTLSEHSKGVLCLAMSPNGQILASGSFDETIKLWHPDTGKLIDTLTRHRGSVRSLAIAPDGQTLISGSFDKTIKLWRLDTGEFLGNLTENAGLVSAIALTPDGQMVASGGRDGIITLRRLDTIGRGTQPDFTLTLTNNLSSISSLAISPDGKIVAAGCTDGNVKLWHLGSGEVSNVLASDSGQVMSVAFSADGQNLIGGHADGTIKLWHRATGRQLSVLSSNSAGSVMSVAIAPDNQLIVGGGADNTVNIWQRN